MNISAQKPELSSCQNALINLQITFKNNNCINQTVYIFSKMTVSLYSVIKISVIVEKVFTLFTN